MDPGREVLDFGRSGRRCHLASSASIFRFRSEASTAEPRSRIIWRACSGSSKNACSATAEARSEDPSADMRIATCWLVESICQWSMGNIDGLTRPTRNRWTARSGFMFPWANDGNRPVCQGDYLTGIHDQSEP
jgi:hypothetical protein